MKSLLKYLLVLFIFISLFTATSFAAYTGMDNGTYKGSKCIHFTVNITSWTTSAIFAVASYSSSFNTLDDMEFVVMGSSACFIGDTSGFTTGTAATPNASARYMALGEKYRINGRNIDTIYGRVEAGSHGTSRITGTIWGH